MQKPEPKFKINDYVKVIDKEGNGNCYLKTGKIIDRWFSHAFFNNWRYTVEFFEPIHKGHYRWNTKGKEGKEGDCWNINEYRLELNLNYFALEILLKD